MRYLMLLTIFHSSKLLKLTALSLNEKEKKDIKIPIGDDCEFVII